MASDANAGSDWERVAAELRACREAQRRAWGDIDNTTLGRYLADEVTSEERRQIDSALDELPELRQLTALVRDVLGESEALPEPLPCGSAILPFSEPQAKDAATAQPVVSRVRRRTAGAAWSWKQRVPAARFRQRAGLVAAAGLLLALSVALPRSGMLSPQSGRLVAMSQPVAFRGNAFRTLTLPGGEDLTDTDIGADAAVRMGGDGTDHDNLLARIDASVQDLEKQGKKVEAETLARQYASNLTRKAMLYQKKGDLARAEPALNQARTLCAKTLGPQAPETIRTLNSLASVYEAALNTVPPPPPLPGASLGANSYTSLGANPYTYHAPAAVQPRGFAAPGYSSSSYRPPMPAQQPPLPAAPPRRDVPSKHAMPHPPCKHQFAAVILRDRITSLSQRELKTSVVPVLTQALGEAANATDRQRLARALGQLGPAARDAVPVLLDCYRKATETPERAAILLSLRQVGPAALVCCEKLAKQRADDPLLREVMHRLNGPDGCSGIDDEGECFSLKAIQQTQGAIRYLATTYHLALRVATLPGKVVAVKEGAEERQRERGGYSVHLFISKDAPSVQVYVSDALQKQGLTAARLREVLEPHLRNKDYDRGLREGVRFLARFEKEHGTK